MSYNSEPGTNFEFTFQLVYGPRAGLAFMIICSCNFLTDRAVPKSSQLQSTKIPAINKLRGMLKCPMRNPTVFGQCSRVFVARRAQLAHRCNGQLNDDASCLGADAGLVVAASRPIAEVFGHPDDLKFRSCVTLFAAAAPDEAGFFEALSACCDGRTDPSTLEKLASLGR